MTTQMAKLTRRFAIMFCVPLALLCGCSFRNPTVASVDPVVFEVAFREDGAHRPNVSLPATLAVARVGYAESANARRVEQGVPLQILRTPDAAGVGPIRDVAEKLDGLRDVWVLQPEMVMGLKADDPRSIRNIARRYNADLLMVYSLSTQKSNTFHWPILSVLTLGWLPNATAEADTTVRAALLDPQSGFVFHRFHAHSRKSQLTNYYVVHQDEDRAADRAEVAAFEQLIVEVEKQWPQVMGNVRANARR